MKSIINAKLDIWFGKITQPRVNFKKETKYIVLYLYKVSCIPLCPNCPILVRICFNDVLNESLLEDKSFNTFKINIVSFMQVYGWNRICSIKVNRLWDKNKNLQTQKNKYLLDDRI